MSVYTAGGPNSQFEKASAKALVDVKNKMAALQKEIVEILQESIATPSRSGAYWAGVERQLALKYNEIVKVYYNHAAAEIPKMHALSLADANRKIANTKKIAETARRTVRQLANSPATSQITKALVSDAVAGMEAASAAGYRNARRLTRATQQALVQEWVIDSAVSEAFARGDLVGEFPGTLAARDPGYAKMLESFKGERVIQAGSKTFTPEYYAELVSRTKFHEAQAFAAVQTAKNYNTDLVVVSNHNTRTEICQPYEAKTFSISGKDPRFPVLDMSPPFHPNCLHLLYPVFESAMEIDGTTQAQSDFSLGKADSPPVPKGYIPIADRGES